MRDAMSENEKNIKTVSRDRLTVKLEIPVVGIVRGIGAERFGPLMQEAFAAGLQAIEVTMNTPGAAGIIRAHRDQVPAGKYLGMGTVRNLSEAREAYEAGAMFFVSPNFDPDVIQFARRKDIPVISGAMTPTEVYDAWEAGAGMIKVFPCRALGGPHYIRELCGPFDHIPLVAVGGVNIENVSEYLRSGAAAIGVGISLFGEQAVQEEDWAAVRKNVDRFIKRFSSE